VKVVYVGPNSAVDVHLEGGQVVHAERDGDPINVADKVGESLLAQKGSWKRATQRKTTPQAGEKKE
jgi:hypothetical protein